MIPCDGRCELTSGRSMPYRLPGSGITLVEILIATSIFALLLVSIMGVFQSGSNAFNAGSWRIQSQRSAQIFLAYLKEAIEKANYAESFMANSDVPGIFEHPIFVKAKWFDKEDAVEDNDVMMFTICKPFQEAQPDLNVPADVPGYWTAVVMQCMQRRLILYRTNDVNALPPSAPAEVGPSDLARFPANFPDGNYRMELNDVDAISIRLLHADPSDPQSGTTMVVTLKLRMYKGSTRTEVVVTESINAKLLRSDHTVRTF